MTNGMGMKTVMALAAAFLLAGCGGDGGAQGGGEAAWQGEEDGARDLRRLAKRGHAGAQCSLALCILDGKVEATNDREAYELMYKAASQGYAEAAYNLGIMYMTGKGVEKDPARAVTWLNKAADGGFDRAQMDLGAIYSEGVGGIKKDYTMMSYF